MLIALLVVVAAPAAVLAWDSGAFSAPDESLLVSLTNQRRASSGLPALTVDGTLWSEARLRSKDMGDNNYFSHSIPPDGHTVFDELKAQGYCYVSAAENYAWNTYPDATATQVAEQGFESSSAHLANILGPAYTRIGVGAYKAANGTKIWAVLFAQPCASTPNPTPAPPAATATPRRTSAPTAPPLGSVATPGPSPLDQTAYAGPVSTPPPPAELNPPGPSIDPLIQPPTSSPLLLMQWLLNLILMIIRILFAMAPG